MTEKLIHPTTNYHLLLPEDAREEYDGRVCSYWKPGEPLLLQLSSYVREQGPQVDAKRRLADRMEKETRRWSIREANLQADPAVDQASAQFLDEKGVLWIHVYLVWPRLTIYATISGPEGVASDEKSWAMHALRSIKPTGRPAGLAHL